MFYTNAVMAGDDLLITEIDKGKRKFTRVSDYKPYLFIPVRKEVETPYKTVFGKTVGKVEFDSIKEARGYIQQYADIPGHTIYGLQLYQYCMINERYPKEVKYEVDQINVINIDIETDSRGGFPNIETADKEIVSIALRRRGENYVFGLRPFTPTDDRTTYVLCKTERELLLRFIELWNRPEWFPDVLTGWNIDLFDVPYLVNRIKAVLGMAYAKRLSPWKFLRAKTIEIGKREFNTYDLVGVNCLDYLQLYRKFSNTKQESYTLDWIGEQELEEKKVDYRSLGYESLSDLYERNHQLFIEYNIQDTYLVEALDEKLNFINLVFAMAYDAKINYIDALTTVRMWDVIIHNELLSDNIVIEPMRGGVSPLDRSIEGAYVKPPLPGRHEYVASFDFESLYPSLEEQHNISPETFVKRVQLTPWQVINDKFDDVKKMAKENDWVITGNGCLYLKNPQGFLPKQMTRLKKKRKEYKKKMFEAEHAMNNATSDAERHLAEYRYAKYDAAQQAVKIQINAAYGALANPYYRWYQPDIAESITASGQMTTMWVEKEMNKWLNQICGTTNYDFVVAADTDSCYFRLDLIVKKMNPKDPVEAINIMDSFCKNYMVPEIAACLERLAKLTNVKASTLNMKRECLGDVGIWTSKKHYILNVHDKEGVRYEKPKVKIMGLEAVKTSTPLIARKALKDCISIIIENDQEKLIKYVADFKREFFNMEFEQIALPRGCNGINKYTDPHTLFIKHTPIHVRAAILYNFYLIKNNLHNQIPLIVDGDKIRFTYLLEPNPFGGNIIANLNKLPDYEKLKQYLDYDSAFEKAFLGPLQSITTIINWETAKGTTFTVDDFFE